MEQNCGVSIYNAPKPHEVVMCNLELTDRAAEVLKEIIENADYDQGYVYITVVGGGCSGYMYDVDVKEDHPPDNTQVVVSKDVEMVITNPDSTLLDGIVIDWIDSLMGGGLKFSNPNATKTCSCGISFK